jgi:hypothetical protein
MIKQKNISFFLVMFFGLIAFSMQAPDRSDCRKATQEHAYGALTNYAQLAHLNSGCLNPDKSIKKQAVKTLSEDVLALLKSHTGLTQREIWAVGSILVPLAMAHLGIPVVR